MVSLRIEGLCTSRKTHPRGASSLVYRLPESITARQILRPSRSIIPASPLIDERPLLGVKRSFVVWPELATEIRHGPNVRPRL